MTREEHKVALIELFDDRPGGRDYFLDDEDRKVIIEALQERPKGRWIEKDGKAVCSECNACWSLGVYFDLADHKADHKFCNECGADMRESE